MKSIFIKATLFAAIATVLFLGVFYVTKFNLFSILFTIGVIATVFCFLAFLFCLIFKKEIKNTEIKMKEDNNGN